MASDVVAELAALAHRVPSLSELFATDPQRDQWLTGDACGIYADFSRQRIDRPLFHALLDLVRQRGIPEKIADMFSGKNVNVTENRAALHVALRGSGTAEAERKKANEQYERVRKVAQHIRDNSSIDTVINIGIGGSDLGPRMAQHALRTFCTGPDIRFVSNIDPADLDAAIEGCDPRRTIVIVSSKTFTTVETMHNAQRVRQWMTEAGCSWTDHFYAVTAHPETAEQWGIRPEHCLHFFEWVGGRYSVSSAIGLPLMVAIGDDNFGAFLDGMAQMDAHVLTAELAHNLPVIHAVVWFMNAVVHQFSTVAVVPYSADLALVPAFLQQLVMESNGKSALVDGHMVKHPTSPVVWGEPGTNSQHAFFQMLHQGTQVVPVEFISSLAPMGQDAAAHNVLLANMIAQSEALAAGSTGSSSHTFFPGNRPSTVVMLDALSPRTLGALIALYEHSVAIQGWLMGINSFDQYGVELGKVLAVSTTHALDNHVPDPALKMTYSLMQWIINKRTSL